MPNDVVPSKRPILSWRARLAPLLLKREVAVAKITEEKQALAKAEQAVKDTLSAQEYLQELAQQIQQKSHKQIAKVVSKCLSSVFKEPYELRIEFDRKRGRTEAEFTYLRGGYKLKPSLTSGGVLEVASLALRLSSLILTLPPARKFISLDEPFGALDAENKPRVAALLESLAKELDVQLIIVTHDPAFRIGKVVEI